MLIRHLTGLIVAFFCLAASANEVPIDQRPTLVVGYYESPPYSYKTSEGTGGLSVEIVRRLLEAAGYRPVFRSLPSARIYQGLQDGSVQIWAGVSGKKELENFTLESRSVFGDVKLNLYRLPSRPAPRIPEDLVGSRVILIRGYSYWKPVNEMFTDPRLKISLYRTSSRTAALKMLQLGRGDFLLDYQKPNAQAVKALNMPLLAFDPLFNVPARLIISRKTPNAEALRDELDRVYQALLAAGEPMTLAD